MKNIIHSFINSFFPCHVMSCRVVSCGAPFHRKGKVKGQYLDNQRLHKVGAGTLSSHKNDRQKMNMKKHSHLPLPIAIAHKKPSRTYRDLGLPVGHLRRQLQAGGVKVVHLRSTGQRGGEKKEKKDKGEGKKKKKKGQRRYMCVDKGVNGEGERLKKTWGREVEGCGIEGREP